MLNELARPRPGRPDRSDFHLPEAEELSDSAGPNRPEHLPKAEEPHDMARCQLCEIARVNPDFEWYNRPRLDKPDRSEPDSELPEAALCNTATCRATALSPLVEPKGQRVLGFADDFTVRKRDAVGLRTPVATAQVFCVLPKAEGSEVGHLLELVRLQAVTRREARKAA